MKLINAHILDAISKAPSAHNTQPCLVKFYDNKLELYLNKDRLIPAIDPENTEALHAIGAVLENIILTLNHFDQAVEYKVANELSFDKALVSLIWQKSTEVLNNKLYFQIPLRRSARDAYIKEEITEADINQLALQCHSKCELKFLTESSKINSIRSLVSRASLSQFEDKEISQELYQWLRFSRRDKSWFRDGLNAECLAWSPVDTCLSKVLLKPKVLQFLSKINMHKLLFSKDDLHAPFAPALCFLVLQEESLQNRIEAGRSLQRTWLKASELGYVTHPISAAVDVEETRKEVKALFNISSETPHVILFRLGRSNKISRSHRLPVDALLI